MLVLLDFFTLFVELLFLITIFSVSVKFLVVFVKILLLREIFLFLKLDNFILEISDPKILFRIC